MRVRLDWVSAIGLLSVKKHDKNKQKIVFEKKEDKLKDREGNSLNELTKDYIISKKLSRRSLN